MRLSFHLNPLRLYFLFFSFTMQSFCPFCPNKSASKSKTLSYACTLGQRLMPLCPLILKAIYSPLLCCNGVMWEWEQIVKSKCNLPSDNLASLTVNFCHGFNGNWKHWITVLWPAVMLSMELSYNVLIKTQTRWHF